MNEEQMFKDILQSMGIINYEPALIVALNEYARRYASEVLCDAKDSATHAQRTELEPADVKLALSLSDQRVTGYDHSDSALQSIRDLINRKDITNVVDPDAVIHRIPEHNLLQRAHTFIPGTEAYPEALEDLESNDNAMDVETKSIDDARSLRTGMIGSLTNILPSDRQPVRFAGVVAKSRKNLNLS